MHQFIEAMNAADAEAVAVKRNWVRRHLPAAQFQGQQSAFERAAKYF
jgi:hypothetical protein